MQRICDKLTLFFICFFFFLRHVPIYETKYIFVFLAVFSLSGLLYFFDQKYFYFACAILFFILCAYFKTFLYFLPLLLYDVFYKKRYLHLALFLSSLIPTIFYLNSYTVMLFITSILISLYLANKTVCQYQCDQEIKHLKDDSRELAYVSSLRQQELIDKHESELHIATLQERNRIAREIHDNVGHLISRSILLVGALKTIIKSPMEIDLLDNLKTTLDQAMNNIRESVHDLKDDSLDLKDMIQSALSYYQNYTIHFHYNVGDSIPRELKYCFLSIIKEALSNTSKHSNADKINLIIQEQSNGYQLLFEDNGYQISNTFSKDYQNSSLHGIGLLNMKERITYFHGNLTISTTNGFKITIFIPRNGITRNDG